MPSSKADIRKACEDFRRGAVNVETPMLRRVLASYEELIKAMVPIPREFIGEGTYCLIHNEAIRARSTLNTRRILDPKRTRKKNA